MVDEGVADDEDVADDDLPPLRSGLRPRRVVAAVAAVAVVAAVVVLIVTRNGDDPGDFAEDVAAAITEGGDERFQSVFCESAKEHDSGVDVFALMRPIQVTVDTVVEEENAHAMAVLVVDKLKADRVFIGMDKRPDWCVSEILLCTTAAEITTDPPRLPCDGLLGRD